MADSRASLHTVILVLLLWMAGLGAAAQFAKISVIFSQIAALYPQAGAEVGLLLSIISLIGIGFGMFAGLIVERFGFRRLLLFAMVLGALISFYQATLPSFWPLLISRLIEGASHLVIVVATPTLIAQISSDKYRGFAMTLWSSFFGVAFAAVALFGASLVQTFGLGAMFIAHGLFMAIVCCLLFFWIGAPMQRSSDPEPLSLRIIIRQHIEAYRSPFVSAPAFGWLFYTLTFVSLVTILPTLVPAEDKTLVLTAMPLASIAVSLIIVALLLQVMSAVRITILGFVLSLLVFSLLWTPISITFVSILLFSVLGLVQGASFAAVPELNSGAQAQAHANGAMAQMGNLGNTIGTPLLLAILATWGMNAMIFIIVVCYGTGAISHLVQMRRRTSV